MSNPTSSDDADRGGNPSEAFLARVYGATDATSLEAAYNEWASSYDRHLLDFGYRNTMLAAGLLCRHVRPGDGLVLDAGCGTGALGADLAVLGYETIGIDLSPGMLERARARGAYRSLHRMALGTTLDFPDAHFAAMVSLGVLTAGHAPPESLDELVRITRPGGHLVFTLTDVAYGELGFREKLEALDGSGVWRPVEVTPHYLVMPGSSTEGTLRSRVFVYQRAP